MWKKILGVIAGGLLILRWSRRLVLAGKLSATRAPGGHFSLNLTIFLAYLALSLGLLFAFAKFEGRGARHAALVFVAVQIAAVAALYQSA